MVTVAQTETRLYKGASRNNAAPRAHIPNAHELAVIEFADNDRYGFVDTAAAQLNVNEAGLLISAGRLAVDGAFVLPKRETGNEKTGVTSLASATLKLQDLDGAVSNLIANKLANRKGTRGKTVRLYRWPVGTLRDPDEHIVGTYQIDNRDWDKGYRNLKLQDVKRSLKTKILIPRVFKLAASLALGQTTATLTSVDDKVMPFWRHSEDYPAEPGKDMFYFALSSDEIVGVDRNYATQTGREYVCTNLIRGALNTAYKAKVINVDAGTEFDNLPSATEWPYIYERFPDMMLGLMAGELFSGLKFWPHWTAGLKREEVEELSLTQAAPELAHLPMVISGEPAAECKKLIEKHALAVTLCTLLTDRFGTFSLKRSTGGSSVGGDAITFDSSNVEIGSWSKLDIITSEIKSLVAIRAGYDPVEKTYTEPVVIDDAVSQSTHGDADIYTIDAKWLPSSILTTAFIKRILPQLGAIHFGEQLKQSFTGLPSTAAVDVGQRVFVKGEARNDSAPGASAERLNRSMIVKSVDPNTKSGGIRYSCYGYSDKEQDYAQTANASDISLDSYRDGGTDIRDDLPAGAIYDNGNGLYFLENGIYPLSFNKKYMFLDGPLYQRYGAEIVGADDGPQFEFWIPHAYHSDSPRTIVTTGKGKGFGGAPGELGSRGFAIPIRGVGALGGQMKYGENSSGDLYATSWTLRSSPGKQYLDYTTGDVPAIALANNNGVLSGLPANLSGYGGIGGGKTFVTGVPRGFRGGTQQLDFDGKPGQRPSAGIMIVHRGFTQGVGQKFIVDGAAGVDPGGTAISASVFWGAQGMSTNLSLQAGSGSGPGTIVMVGDGNVPSGDLGELHVDAFIGQTIHPGARPRSASSSRERAAPFHSFYEALPRANMAAACAISIYAPAAAVAQDRLNVFQKLFEGQTDFSRDILITSSDVAPSGGNDGDFGGWSEYLDSGLEEPPIWINKAGTWSRFNWSGDERLLGKLVVTAHRTFKSTRVYGGTEVPANPQPNSVFLHTGSGEVLFLPGPGQRSQLFMQDLHDGGSSLISDYAMTKQVLQAQHHWSESQDRWAKPVMSNAPIGDAPPTVGGIGGGGAGTAYTVTVAVSAGNTISGGSSGFDGRGGYITGVTDPAYPGFGTTNIVADGSWSATPPAGMPTGRYKVYVALADNSQFVTTEFDYTA